MLLAELDTAFDGTGLCTGGLVVIFVFDMSSVHVAVEITLLQRSPGETLLAVGTGTFNVFVEPRAWVGPTLATECHAGAFL